MVDKATGKISNELSPGELVYLEKKRPLNKQEPLYSGPYPIKKRIGKATYALKDTPGNIPDIQNIQHLRKHHDDSGAFPSRSQQLATPDETTGEWEVEAILDHRGAGATRRYLVKWKNSNDHTWLPTQNLTNAQDILNRYIANVLKTTQVQEPTNILPKETSQRTPKLQERTPKKPLPSSTNSQDPSPSTPFYNPRRSSTSIGAVTKSWTHDECEI